MNVANRNFQSLLDGAIAFHGHLCGGQIIGVRMAVAGLREIGIEEPKGKDNKNLIVLVEIDRCATDAIISVTGCTPGKRSLKLLDYGKMAATFVNMKTGKAVRVNATTESRRKAEELEKELTPRYGKEKAFLEALMMIPEEELLSVREVTVQFRPEDLPGLPQGMVTCSECGETVLDLREVNKDGKAMCRTCSEGRAYYAPKIV